MKTKEKRKKESSRIIRRRTLLVGVRATRLPLQLDRAEGPYRQQRRLGGILRRQPDFRVDVEQALDTAGRPDGAGDAKLVGLEVVVVVRALDGEGRRDLRGC